MLSPARLVSRAAWAGLDGLALTDHDCVDGVDEALAAADEHGLELIPGIELSVQVDGRDVHVLGAGRRNGGKSDAVGRTHNVDSGAGYGFHRLAADDLALHAAA